MSIHPADSDLFASVFGTEEVRVAFSDERCLASMLEVEGALARAQARAGVIPADAAQAISEAAGRLKVDPRSMAPSTERTGMPLVGLVAALRAALPQEHANYVHFGATTQDIVDTASVLQLREALSPLERDLRGLTASLAERAWRERSTPMVGRTFLQHAAPITFGYKCAVWLAPLLDDLQRLETVRCRALIVQFGGAVGTLAALGDRGRPVVEHLAEELAMGRPLAPWHAARDRVAEVGAFLSILCGNLAKLGGDLILLHQTEVAEVTEAADGTHGASSTMPQKRNPVLSAYVVAAARGVQALAPLLSRAMDQEHERGPAGWYAERLALPSCVALTAGAVSHARAVVEVMTVDPVRMRRNLESTGGLVMAERIAFALADRIGLVAAQELVRGACTEAAAGGESLPEVWARDATRAALLDRAAVALLCEPLTYLGEATAVVDRVLERARAELAVSPATAIRAERGPIKDKP